VNLIVAIIGLIVGLLILYFSSEITVDKMIKLASMLGVSVFTIGFVVSSIGSDLPEIVNSVISAAIGHGSILIGTSFGSVNAQISLVLGLIPFFCIFCRLIPSTFFLVGITEVILLIISVFLSLDGKVSRFDGIILILLWLLSVYIFSRLKEEPISVDESEKLGIEHEDYPRLGLIMLGGFIGIGVGSYLVIESVITISRFFGVSEFIISFFFLSLGTSMPELIVSISAIKKRHFELAIGDIIGSCVVDSTLAVGIGPLLFPIVFDGSELLFPGIYAVFVSIIVVSVLSYRQVHDKLSGGLFLGLYLLTWIIPLFI
jgi:cation:H+ antiporter